MSDPVNLAEVRAVKASDSRLWTPLDALKALVRDIEAGEVKASHLAVHYYEAEDDGGRRHRYCVSNLTYEEHIALLHVALARTLDDWRR